MTGDKERQTDGGRTGEKRGRRDIEREREGESPGRGGGGDMCGWVGG